MKDLIITLLIIVAIIVISNNVTNTNEVVIVKTDTVYKHDTTTFYKKGNSIPFVVLDTLYQIDEIHDTVRILQDYVQVKAYADTIKVDSSSFIILDTISRNSIIGRRFTAQISEKTIYINKTITLKPKNELYLGVLGDLRAFDNKVGLGVGLGFKTAKNGLFTINATTNNYSFGYYKKLF
jgi:hypothetical protein